MSPGPSPVVELVKHGRTASLSIAASTLGTPAAQPPVLVLGAPRSGTTWLMELLSDTAGWGPIYEPLRPGSDRSLPSVGRLDGFLQVGDADKLDLLTPYLQRVFDGRRLSHWSVSQSSLRRHVKAARLVIKMIRACGVASELARRFPDSPILAIRRSAAGFVSSLINSPGPWHGWSETQMRSLLPSAVEQSMPPGACEVQLLTGWWAAQHMGLDAVVGSGRAIAINYEELRSAPMSVIPRVFTHLELGVPDDIDDRLAKPSATASVSLLRSSDAASVTWAPKTSQASKRLPPEGLARYTTQQVDLLVGDILVRLGVGQGQVS